MKLTSPAAALLAAALAIPGAAQAAPAAQPFSLVDSSRVVTISATGNFEERNPAWKPGSTTEPETLSFCADVTYVVSFGPTPTKDVYRYTSADGAFSAVNAFWENHRPVVHGNVTARWCNLPDVAEGVPDPRNGTVYTSFTTQWNGYMEWTAVTADPWSGPRFRLFMETRSGTSGSGPLFSEARLELDGPLADGATGLPSAGHAWLSAYGHDAAQRHFWVDGSFTASRGKAGAGSAAGTVRPTFHQVQGQLPSFTMVDQALPVTLDLKGEFQDVRECTTRQVCDESGCRDEQFCPVYPVTGSMSATLQPSPSRDGRYEEWVWWAAEDGTPVVTEQRYNFWTSHRTTFQGSFTIHKPAGPVTFGLTTHSNLSSGYNTYHLDSREPTVCWDDWNQVDRCREVYAEASYDYFIPTVETGAGAPDFVDGGGWMGGGTPFVSKDVIPKLPPAGRVRFDFRGPRVDWSPLFWMNVEGTYRAR